MGVWDNQFAWDILPDLLKAFLRYTLIITVLGSVIAAVLGLVFAIIRQIRVPVLSQVVTAFIEFVRSTPIPVQLFFIYYALGNVGFKMSALTAGVATLGIHYACYYAEVYRAGIQGVPKGQWEACTALSLPRRYVWQSVVLPQALRSVTPALGNYVISLFKEVPFLAVLGGVPELVETAQQIGGDQFRYVEPYTLAGLIYLAASYPAAVAIRKLEKHLGHA